MIFGSSVAARATQFHFKVFELSYFVYRQKWSCNILVTVTQCVHDASENQIFLSKELGNSCFDKESFSAVLSQLFNQR